MGLKPFTNPHPWNLKPKKAVTLQKHLAGKVIRKSGIEIENVATVAGVDTHFRQSLAIAAVVVIRLSDLATVICVDRTSDKLAGQHRYCSTMLSPVSTAGDHPQGG